LILNGLNGASAIERFEQLEQYSMAVSGVPDIAGQEMAIRSGHRISLELAFRAQK
jgi:hypothetical protein